MQKIPLKQSWRLRAGLGSPPHLRCASSSAKEHSKFLLCCSIGTCLHLTELILFFRRVSQSNVFSTPVRGVFIPLV